MISVSNTSVHFFVNISIPWEIFSVFSISIEFLLCLQWKWNKQGVISKFRDDVDFLIPNKKHPRFYFFLVKSHTPIFLILLSKKHYQDFFKNLWWKILCNICHEASNLCQTLSKNGNCSIFRKNVKKTIAMLWRHDLWEQ